MEPDVAAGCGVKPRVEDLAELRLGRGAQGARAAPVRCR
jgi:hypothetical protein